jgi:hypothetical protein
MKPQRENTVFEEIECSLFLETSNLRLHIPLARGGRGDLSTGSEIGLKELYLRSHQ